MANIVIVYEHKAREMETVLLLSHELRKKGHYTELYPVCELNRIKYLFNKPDLVIVPFLYGNNELVNYVYSVFGCVRKILNLQWEQVYGGLAGDSKKGTPRECAQKAVHICWGYNSYKRLIDNGCKHAVLTGAPQLDFLKPQFKGWYGNRDELFKDFKIDSRKKTILFISSFSYLGLSKKRLSELRGRVNLDPFYFYDLTVKTRNVVLDWFEKLLASCGNINIIYRPHPGEFIDKRLTELNNKYSNLHVISDHSVKEWIIASDIILNWYSTAGVEVFFAGKSNLFLRPIEIPKDIDYEMFDNACMAKTYEEFYNYIINSGSIESYYLKNDLKNKIAPYYYVRDTLAYKNILNVIEKMLKSKKYDLISNNYSTVKKVKIHAVGLLYLLLYNAWKQNNKLVKYLVKRNKHLSDLIRIQETTELDRITKEDVRRFEDKLSKLSL